MPRVRIVVKLKPALLDSAGRAVLGSLHGLGYDEVTDVRIGKTVDLDVTDDARVAEMADRLLANPVIEDFSVERLEG